MQDLEMNEKMKCLNHLIKIFKNPQNNVEETEHVNCKQELSGIEIFLSETMLLQLSLLENVQITQIFKGWLPGIKLELGEWLTAC